MNFVWFLLIGLVAGFVAGKIWKGSGFGLIGDLVIGVVGAILGGWVLGLLGISFGGLIGALVTAVIGALLLLWIVRLIKK